MSRATLFFLALAFAAFAASYVGQLVGLVSDYVNEEGRLVGGDVRFFLVLDNGTWVPVEGEVPWGLVGTGEKVIVEGTLEGDVLRVSQAMANTVSSPPQRPVRGVLQVAVVAAKFSDVTDEPYNYSYIHDVVFGPFPSVRDFWERSSNGAVKLRPFYVHPRWLNLDMSTADYCNVSDVATRLRQLTSRIVERLYYDYGVALPDGGYLIIVLNAQPSCEKGIAGWGTIKHWDFSTPYGQRQLAVSWIYHYADWLKQRPDVAVYIHEFGHNLGLRHPGPESDEYEDARDVMGDGEYWRRLDSWWLSTWYLVPADVNVYHKFYLGWADLVYGSNGVYVIKAGSSGLAWVGDDGAWYVGDYRCWTGPYDAALPFCGLTAYRVEGDDRRRWVFFVRFLSRSVDSFLDVGQVASVGGVDVFVSWRNSTHAAVGLGRPTLYDLWRWGNASFVVGGGASTFDSLGAAAAAYVLRPVLFNVYLSSPYWYMEWARRLSPAFSSFLDWELLGGGGIWQIRYNASFLLPGVVVSVGGPLANGVTRMLNPPGGPGVDGLPFYYDPSVGGIRDARTGQVWTGNVAVVASVAYGGRVYLLVWGLGAWDTYRAAVWLRDCVPPPARGVVIRTTDFYILASWPEGFEGSSICKPAVYDELAVVGESAASIDAVGAALLATGGVALDSWVVEDGQLKAAEPYVFSVGGPYPNLVTRLYNPADRVGFGGLPFYYDSSAGGIRDARTGQLCSGRCFVVASLLDGIRRVVLAWGISGEDTRAAALYAALNKETLKRARGNVAYLVSWEPEVYNGRVVGVRFNVMAMWLG